MRFCPGEKCKHYVGGYQVSTQVLLRAPVLEGIPGYNHSHNKVQIFKREAMPINMMTTCLWSPSRKGKGRAGLSWVSETPQIFLGWRNKLKRRK